ncbi:MAG: nuclear transport factor 2 family protein [Longimicrobiales bacterium]
MTRSACAALLTLALCLTATADSVAQGLTAKPARPEDVRSLDAIITAFYDVISHGPNQAIDWARDSTLYLADLRFKIIGGPAGSERVQLVDHASYARSNADVTQGFFEREIHRVTQRFGPMVQVFSTYEWRRTVDGPVSGRGINSIELFFDGTRWWISSAMWASETPQRLIPAEYLK